MSYTTQGSVTPLYLTDGVPPPVYLTTGQQVINRTGSTAEAPAVDTSTLTATDKQVAKLTIINGVSASKSPDGGETAVCRITFASDATNLRFWLRALPAGTRGTFHLGGGVYPLQAAGNPVMAGEVLTDPIGDIVVAAGSSAELRLFFPAGSAKSVTKVPMEKSGVLAGEHLVGGSLSASAAATFSPYGVIGDTTTQARSIMCDGDSILTKDWHRSVLVGAGFAVSDRGVWGIQVNSWDPLFGGALERSPWDYFLFELGTNNSGNPQPATFQKAIDAMYRYADAGALGAQTTLLPRSTSTDRWATVEGQTPSISPEWREDWNAWVRDGSPVDSQRRWVAPGTSGALRAGDPGHMLAFPCFDLAAAVEVPAAGSHVWAAGSLTDDGTHPTDAGVALMRSAFSQYVARTWG